MGCSSCGSGADGAPSGCGNKGHCTTGGCNMLNSFDWLSDMSLPGIDPFDIVEIRFKGGRKGFYKNTHKIFLESGDAVVVASQSGHHIGHVALQGELVRLQMRKKKVADENEIAIIYRKATEKDLEKFEDIKKREMPTMFRTRQIIKELNLSMKLSDIEYQADNTKATFFYSADNRIDFRELIKVLAGEFKIRVEMRQISLRQEAGRIGGIGSCGRELCCSTWLTDFQSVSTSAARYQNLSLNPQKLSGQCGRLKCCLNYELETYQDALIDIPDLKAPLDTEKGPATLQKVDIFKKTMWFSLEEETAWFPVDAARVKEILELNAEGKKVASLELNDWVQELDKISSADSSRTSRNNKRKKPTARTKPDTQSEKPVADKPTERGVKPQRRSQFKKGRRKDGDSAEKPASEEQDNKSKQEQNKNNGQKQNGNTNKKRPPRRKKPNQPQGDKPENANPKANADENKGSKPKKKFFRPNRKKNDKPKND